MTHSVVLEVTQRLTERSREARAAFLARTEVQAEAGKKVKVKAGLQLNTACYLEQHILVLVVKRQVANKAAVRWKFSVLLREAYVPLSI